MSICTDPVVPAGDSLNVNGYSDLSASSFGGNPVSVLTSVTISYDIETEFLGPGNIGTVTVSSGNSSGSATIGLIEGDTILSITITNISLFSFQTQTYANGGTTFAGNCN
jgi:hypothetical protein